jgi:NADPH:quinone reductase-like Zn-dependent oxidoreductase
MARGRERQARLIGLGASHVIDRLKGDIVEEVLRLTGGKDTDLGINPVGFTLQSSLPVLAPEGRLVFLGKCRGNNLNVDLWQPMQNQTLHGVFMGPLLERPAVYKNIDALLEAAARKCIEVFHRWYLRASGCFRGSRLRGNALTARSRWDDTLT